MRPAAPVPATYCNGIPRSQARLRTAGDARGRSPGLRTAPAGVTGLNGGESRDGASACFDTSFPAVSVATAMPVADREELAWEDRPSGVCPRPTAGIAAGDTVSPVLAGAPAAGIPVAGIPVAGTPAAA